MKKIHILFLTLILLSSSHNLCADEDSKNGSIIVAETQETISLDVKGMDLINVLKMLASKSKLNIVIDKNVAGRVTLFLDNVSPERAMEVVLASNHLVKKEEAGIVRIMTAEDYERFYGDKPNDPKETMRIKLKYARPTDVAVTLKQIKSGIGQIIVDEASGTLILNDTKEKNIQMAQIAQELDSPQETQVFKLNYARCEKVAEILNDVVTKGIGRIKIDSRSNKLIITDYEPTLRKIKEMLMSLDERTKEVIIDAKILQVNLNDKTSLGIDWEYVLNKKLKLAGMFGQVISTTGNKWTIGTASPSESNDYQAIVEVLQTIGETKILSSPRLTVTNNQEAKILVGSKQVYVTTSAFQSQTSTETAESVNFVDVGVRLHVTPAISHDGFISMKVNPEVSSVVQNYTTATGNEIPIVETSEAQTEVLVRDGATIVIAGLMKEEKIKKVNKIPIIGDIPFLGLLFRNSVEEIKKTELVIFLTCHILKL